MLMLSILVRILQGVEMMSLISTAIILPNNLTFLFIAIVE